MLLKKLAAAANVAMVQREAVVADHCSEGKPVYDQWQGVDKLAHTLIMASTDGRVPSAAYTKPGPPSVGASGPGLAAVVCRHDELTVLISSQHAACHDSTGTWCRHSSTSYCSGHSHYCRRSSCTGRGDVVPTQHFQLRSGHYIRPTAKKAEVVPGTGRTPNLVDELVLGREAGTLQTPCNI